MPVRTLILVLMMAACALAQAPKPTQPAAAKSVRVSKITAKIKVDGRLDEPVWQTLKPITDFVQTTPNEGAPVSERTEVLIFYDEDNIYFGFRCFDSEPKKIVARLGAHDGRTNSDSVNVLLDTFHDRRTAFYFDINARGIQFDAITNESRGTGWEIHDSSWDGHWYSAAVVQDWGWSAEIVVPFKSIRLSKAQGQVWGINIGRDIVRKNESARWSFVPLFDETMKPSTAATLEGIEGVHGGRNLELIPYMSTRYRRSQWRPELQGFNGNGGLDARYGISNNFTANLTVNPDFGETEADEFTSQISRFEIFFPEKRKFFTEGANYFETPMQVAFSRRIGALLPDGEPQRILQGGKITGKRGKWTLGALESLTQDTSYVDPADGVRKTAPQAFFGIVRLQRDIFEKSAIGFISVNRFQQTGPIGQNEHTQGIDLDLRSGKHVSLTSQVIVNTNDAHPGFGFQHGGAETEFRYNSDRWEYYAAGKFLGRNVDMSNTGYEPEVDRYAGQGTIRYKPMINRYGIRRIIGELTYDEGNGTRGELEDAGADARLTVEFKNFWSFKGEYSYDRTRFYQFTPTFTALQWTRGYEVPRVVFTLSSNENRVVSAAFQFQTGRMVQYEENFYGAAQVYSLTGTARMGPHFRWEFGGTDVHETLLNGSYFQDRRYVTSRLLFQATPKWRARVLAQFADTKRGTDISINSLLAYDFTARTALFIGYNRQRNVPLVPSDLGNVAFVKLSYLFSL